MTHRLRWPRAAAVGVALLLVGGACNSGTGSTVGITLPAATLALASVPARPRTTPPPATTAAPPDAPSTGAPVPTPVPASTPSAAGGCDTKTVTADIGPPDQGYSFADLHCAGLWATVVAQSLQPNISTDELIVLHSAAAHWSVLEGGGSTTCQTAGVPAELSNSLACARWQRGS